MRVSLRDESGIAIIEVMVSAILVGVLATASFDVLDRAQGTGAANRARSVAANLAKEDQGRLRALDHTTVANMRGSRIRTVGGINYTVNSRADPVREASGTVTCSADGTGADYFKITSSVLWPEMKAKPVTAVSLVAAQPGTGNGRGVLTVKLQNAASGPVPGIAVQAAGLTDLTNEMGCAVFARLAAGNTQVAFGQNGWVTPEGTTYVNQSATVANGQTALLSLQYDRAATAPATFNTKHPTSGAVTSTTSTALSVAHASLAGPRIFTSTTPATSIVATPLFPFTSAYSMYAGSCSGNNPTLYNPSYFATNPGLVQTAPGASAASSAIRVPTMTFPVRRYKNSGSGGSTENLNGARIVIRANTGATAMATCTARYDLPVNAGSNVVTVPIPFGSYIVCASDGAQYGTAVVDNFSPNGVSSPGPIVPKNGPQAGLCP